MELAKQIAQILLEVKAVKVSTNPPFTWTSGIKSPIYCDNRVLIAYPKQRKVIVDGFKKIIEEQNLEFDYVAGTATAGIPWAAFLAHEINKPMIYIRPEPKAYGAGKQIEGFLPADQKILLIEDLISTGGSSLKAVQAIENEGKGKVVSVFSIMNYEMDKAKQAFKNANLNLVSLTNFSVLAGEAKEMGYIEDINLVLEFQADPENWYKKLI